MKTLHSERFSSKVITLAVQGVLVAMFAVPLSVFAQEEGSEEVTALTQPINSVEIGAESIPKDAAKFGEYNGLDKKGAYLIGNFSMRGGDAYNAYNGGSGTNRWELKGTDLGTTSRELSGNVSDQGKWSFGIDYDELRHNITNSYQTPFQGSMGGNNFILPTSFGSISTTALGPGPITTARGSNILTPVQQAAFNTPDVYSQRDNAKFNAAYTIDQQWDVKFDFSHLKQSGAKLQGVAGDQVNGVTTATVSPAGQTPLVIMMPTNYITDTLNLALNWAGDKGYATASYFGSFFRDDYNSVSFSNPFVKTVAGTAGTTASLQDTISTMPSNSLNQLNLTGGYNFTSATKLVGGLSYGRNTQNDAYSVSGLMAPGFSLSSLDGLIVSTHADVKLTNQASKDLELSASLKYNERDNQTASNAYQFYTINSAATVNQIQTSVNAPMSNSKTQFDLGGDYRIDKNQKINLSYGYEEIKRWCSGVVYPLVTPTTTSTAPVVGNPTGFVPYTATGCAEVPDSKENKIAATYKLKATDALNFNAGYGYADRIADINPLFYNPMQTTGTAAQGAVGSGYEIPGFMAYMDASRKEQILKGGVNWQANEKLSLGFNGRYTFDKYDSTYGVQNGNSWSLNLDATYASNENSSFSAYATTQNKSRDLTNLQSLTATVTNGTTNTALKPVLQVPAGGTWTNKLNENDMTLGLGAKQDGLMGGKLDLTGDLTYSLDKTSYGTQLNYASVDFNGNTCYSAFYMTCGDLPDIKSEMLQLKFTGSYKVDKVSKIKVGYMFQHLISNDYLYNAYQYGSTPTTLLPTNQQAPTYSTNVVSVSFIHTF
jgi:MtrB/PioB family decaheme-associated outer membrane protein